MLITLNQLKTSLLAMKNFIIEHIPTNISDLNNDAGYLTQHQDISGKANVSDLAVVATSGSYNDLTNKPTIPTAVSELTNDSNFTTQSYVDGEIDDLQTTISTKANIDGSYDSMSVKESERLASLSFTEDNTPYLFRKSGGDGNEEPVIVGGSVVWNQLHNFVFTRYNTSFTTFEITEAGHEITVTLTNIPSSTSQNYVHLMQDGVQKLQNHVYLLSARFYSEVPVTWRLPYNTKSVSGVAGWNAVKSIMKRDSDGSASGSMIGLSNAYTAGMEVGDTYKIRDYNVTDLTAAFGTTIADYIFTLESATDGAGIAWLKKYGFFTSDYYPYSEPTFKHVEGLTAHKMVGFNQWDGKYTANAWFNGNSTGAITGANGYNLTGYIPVIPGKTYYHSNTGSQRSLYFDTNKSLVGAGSWSNAGQYATTFVVPEGAYYIRFTVKNENIANFIINLSDPAKNGTYEPYKVNTYPLDDSLTLRGIPKLDANNDLYYDGDTYEEDGTVTRKYGLVDLGTLSWSYYTSGTLFMYASPSRMKSGTANVFCSLYQKGGSSIDKSFSVNGGTIRVYDSTYTDAATFKAAMSGVYLVYELATSTTESADPFQTPQVVDDWGTEEWVFDNNSFPIPVGHKTKYRDIVTIQDVKNIQSNINNKQDTLIFDSTPTANSVNPVTSGGIKTALDNYVKLTDYPYILDSGAEITASANLNVYTTPGTYVVDSTIMASVTNAPTTTVSYKLIVEQLDTYVVRQTAITSGTPSSIYQRTGNSSSSAWVWGDWIKCVTSIDYATNNTSGVVKTSGSIGMLPTGEIGIISASDADIKAGISTTNAIVPGNQHRSIFYGLAKAAGDVTQSSSNNAVGLYTEEAKTAIKSMLDIVDGGGSGVYIGSTEPVGNENVWIDTNGDPDIDSQGIVNLQEKINQVKNLQAPAILSDTYSGTLLQAVSVNIPAGTYTLEIDSLTSSDVDTELNLVTFIYSGGSLSVKLPRGMNIKKKVTLKGNVTTIYLYASDSYANSVGDDFSFTGFKLTTGYLLKDEVEDLSQTVQGLSGRYTSYEAVGRTFTDNTLAYIGANNTITLGNNAGYAVYKYKITEPTSFIVTGSTRGGSNYLAIATDDDGRCVQLIEPGVPSTTTSYSNFQFTIDNYEATTVYICLYKQATDDVRVKLNKDMKELSILFIGNSLTQDGIAYLPYLLTKYYPRFRFRFYMWYNGGYNLSQQYAKFTADTECESFSIAENSSTWTNTTAKMSDILSTYRFNVVCMQEYFNRKTSYTDTDLTDWNNCRDYIVSHYIGGNALEFISLFHSPWLTDEQSVFDLTKTGNALILKKTIADDMIATGIALYMARSTALDSLGDRGHLTPDDVHAQEGLPCLLEAYTALLWVLDRYGFPTSIYGLPFKMTAGIQSSIAVPGANVGTGVIEGTDAQNLLAQEVAVMAYKMGKKFVVDNLVPTL